VVTFRPPPGHNPIVIKDESPLRHLPSGLNARQVMYFDGIRYAVEMLDASFTRLASGIEEVVTVEQADNAAVLFLDAWSVVDSANRLRVLMKQFPGMKRDPPVRILQATLAKVEALRNSVQHLPGDIQEHSERGTPTWGSLHWLWVDDYPDARIFMTVPGTMRKMSSVGSVLSPSGRAMYVNPEFISLEAYGNVADLSAVHRAVAGWFRDFEQAAGRAFAPHEARAGSDLLLIMDMTIGDAPDADVGLTEPPSSQND